MVSNKLIKIDTSPILLWPYNENKTYIFANSLDTRLICLWHVLFENILGVSNNALHWPLLMRGLLGNSLIDTIEMKGRDCKSELHLSPRLSWMELQILIILLKISIHIDDQSLTCSYFMKKVIHNVPRKESMKLILREWRNLKNYRILVNKDYLRDGLKVFHRTPHHLRSCTTNCNDALELRGYTTPGMLHNLSQEF